MANWLQDLISRAVLLGQQLESALTADQIERTSSCTLLELMTVSGLACSSVMYLSDSTYAGLLLYFVQASILGIASVLVDWTIPVSFFAMFENQTRYFILRQISSVRPFDITTKRPGAARLFSQKSRSSADRHSVSENPIESGKSKGSGHAPPVDQSSKFTRTVHSSLTTQ